MKFPEEDVDHVMQLLTTEDRAAVVLLVGKAHYHGVRCTWVAERLRTDKSHHGMYCAPGGGALPGETSRAAAVRECREEAGVELRPENLVYRGYIVTQDDAVTRIVALYIVELPDGMAPTDQPSEAGKLGPWKWCPLASVEDIRLTPATAALVGIAQALYDMAPRRMVLPCEMCRQPHVDKLEPSGMDWSKKAHRTHLCHNCGHGWRPRDAHGQVLPYATVGIDPAEVVCDCGATEENARRALQRGPFSPMPHQKTCPVR